MLKLFRFPTDEASQLPKLDHCVVLKAVFIFRALFLIFLHEFSVGIVLSYDEIG